MEKEFIPYNEALALKELGFDEKCLASFYTYADENFVFNKYDYRGKFNINYSEDDDYIINTNKKHYISAPLYQQAFRWFREKYTIDCNVEPIGISRRFYSIYICFKNNEEIKGDGNYYETYEEAELECLKKLIEIVKENK